MSLDELLNHSLLKLPKVWTREGFSSYHEAISHLGREFLGLIESVDEEEFQGRLDYIGEVSKEDLLIVSREVFRAVRKCINVYLDKGNPHKAYDEFAKHFVYESSKRKSRQPNFIFEVWPLYPSLYRLRAGKINGRVEDLFHVPFDLRQKLGSYRYSIPGYPALYLSSNIYTAYRELGAPDYEDLYVSEFQYSGVFNNEREYLLYLLNRPTSDDLGAIYKYLARWPLIMACNMKLGYPNSPFKSEYVLPQIVFQWAKNKYKIRGKKIAGVIYPSTRLEEPAHGFYNVAIPVHHSNKTGFCDVLSKMFRLKRPLSFHEALKHDNQSRHNFSTVPINHYGANIDYLSTDFYKIEQVLRLPEYNSFYQVNRSF
jgi:hypothetical protein